MVLSYVSQSMEPIQANILESPINLKCMTLDCGSKPEYPKKTHQPLHHRAV